MERETAIASVGHAIQLSVAPVFLLSGIGAMLAVLTNRLARVVDRAREVEERLEAVTEPESKRLHADLFTLSQRAKLINRAITFCIAPQDLGKVSSSTRWVARVLLHPLQPSIRPI